MTCETCRHHDPRTYSVPTCAHPKAYRPNGHQEACVLKRRHGGECKYWVKR